MSTLFTNSSMKYDIFHKGKDTKINTEPLVKSHFFLHLDYCILIKDLTIFKSPDFTAALNGREKQS